jgi:hypothetical protein
MTPEIKDPRVPIDSRAMQPQHHFDPIASFELERREERSHLRIVQKLSKTSASSIRMVIDALDFDIQVDAKPPPLRWL